MKITVKTTFDFGKLAKYVSSGEFSDQVFNILGTNIAEASRAFIKSGKVKPPLKDSTIEIRKKRGISGIAPLYATGVLAESLKATKEGIKGAFYGKQHLTEFITHQNSMIPNKTVPQRNFIAFDKEKIKQPFKELMKKVGRALKK